MAFSDGFEGKGKTDIVWITEFKFHTVTNGKQSLHKKIALNYQLQMQKSYVNIYQYLVIYV